MSTVDQSTLCPVCGFDLGFAPWNGDLPSHEICPSCGIEFGYDDDVEVTHDEAQARLAIHQAWREKWIGNGMKWWSSRAMPEGWDPIEQLRRIGVTVGR